VNTLNINRCDYAAIVLLALLTLIRIYHISTTQVLDDEAYYYVWTQHLSAGYIDGGPVIAYVNKVFVSLFGANGFAVRIGAVALSSAMNIYLFFWAKRNFSDVVALLLLAFVSITPICFLSSIVHTYDTEMASFMLIAIAVYYDAFFNDPRKFYLAGLLLGLALLSKISVAFSAVALFLMPVLVREIRVKHCLLPFLASFAIALLILSPLIYWEISHDMAITHFRMKMLQRPITWKNIYDVWSLQAIIFLPILFFYCLTLPAGFIYRQITRTQVAAQYLYFAWIAAFPLGYFFIDTLRHHYNGNWLVPGFFGGFFLTALYMGEHWDKQKKYAFTHIALCTLLIAAFIGDVFWNITPVKKIQKFTNRFFMYQAMPNQIKQYLADHPELAALRIVSTNYQIPSLANLYIQPNLEAVGLSLGNYHDTLYSELYPKSDFNGQPLLVLTNGEGFPNECAPCFNGISKLQTFTVLRADKEINKLTLWHVDRFVYP
jgi:4-amino-4-deoxy-L-arabinose transferase-like glycosyltransferase